MKSFLIFAILAIFKCIYFYVYKRSLWKYFYVSGYVCAPYVFPVMSVHQAPEEEWDPLDLELGSWESNMDPL